MDRRTKRQKLQDMANQTTSPHEADIARKKLESMEPDNMVYGRSEHTINITFTFNADSFWTQWSNTYPVSGFGEY